MHKELILISLFYGKNFIEYIKNYKYALVVICDNNKKTFPLSTPPKNNQSEQRVCCEYVWEWAFMVQLKRHNQMA